MRTQPALAAPNQTLAASSLLSRHHQAHGPPGGFCAGCRTLKPGGLPRPCCLGHLWHQGAKISLTSIFFPS